MLGRLVALQGSQFFIHDPFRRVGRANFGRFGKGSKRHAIFTPNSFY